MKIKVLSKQKQTKDGKKYVAYFTPVRIMVKGEEEKGLQDKYLSVYFTKVAEKKLPVDFKRGLLDVDGEKINFPYVYERKVNEDGSIDYPEVWIRDINTIEPVKAKAVNTCSFITDEEETEETNIEE